MENKFETVAYGMLGRDLSVLLANLRQAGFRTERDSCAGTASAYAPDGRCVFRALEMGRRGRWIVRAVKGLITVETVSTFEVK